MQLCNNSGIKAFCGASKLKKPKATQRKPSPVRLDVDDVEDIDDCNSDDDPEWRNTPMARRIRKLKEKDEDPSKMFDLEKNASIIGKRLSRSHCSCSTGGCRSCICSRDNFACTFELYGCSASGVCKNVAPDNVLVRWIVVNRVVDVDIGACQRYD
ncbi:hypothetical protein OUZ56_021437 [Daphnia magna]|uniref:Cysteine/serine-rich nuclear protein N-terminal domain-containing protein n=1 Tax=Daphnia magna TaxID=35525 RepID=A0ABQ9ZHE9_9CRUS|nr:hypothetical protein OUZ56_021437 [Daphnia magna]